MSSPETLTPPAILDLPASEEAAAAPAPSPELIEIKDRYLAWLIATRYAETTVTNGASDLDWLLKFFAERGVARVADATSETLNDFALWLREHRHSYDESRGISLGTILHRLTTTRQFFRWLKKEGEILYDPSQDMEIPQRPSTLPKTILTQEEARRLLDAPDLRSPVGYRDKALLELLYATGLRTAELLRLKVKDIDFAAATVFVREGKGGKDRLIAVPHLTLGYLREYVEKVRPRFAAKLKKDDGTVFLNWTGAKVEINGMGNVFTRSAKLAGIDKHVTALTFRHSIASHLLENGMSVRYIQDFLGHSRLATTQVYTRVNLSGLRRYFNRHHPREKRMRTLA